MELHLPLPGQCCVPLEPGDIPVPAASPREEIQLWSRMLCWGWFGTETNKTPVPVSFEFGPSCCQPWMWVMCSVQQLQSRALKKGKIEEGRKEKVMLGFAKTNDPIWALSLEPVRGQECW